MSRISSQWCMAAVVVTALVTGCGTMNSYITVETIPSDAKVYADGEYAGQSPLDVPCLRDHYLTLGKTIHRPNNIRAEKEGYVPTERLIHSAWEADTSLLGSGYPTFILRLNKSTEQPPERDK